MSFVLRSTRKIIAVVISFLAFYLLALFLLSLYLKTELIYTLLAALISVLAFVVLGLLSYLVINILSFIKGLLFKSKHKKSPVVIEERKSTDNTRVIDVDRRDFLKLIGSFGVGAFLLALFAKEAKALQFGGTGTPDQPLGNSQTTGSVTLTSADTWYQIPSSNLSSRVFISVHNRSGYDMFWTFDDNVNSSTGGMLFPDGANLMLDAGDAVSVYVRCGTAAQVCWYAESQSN